jgi:hypothetical protein
MPLSSDPERRAKQLANLQPAGATKHGAQSERKLAPLREKHRAELLERFPRIDEQRLSLLCDLLARIDLAREFIDTNGVMKNSREAYPLLQMVERWEGRCWRMMGELIPRHEKPTDDVHRPGELLDPFVQRYVRAFLQAVNVTRTTNKGHQPTAWELPPRLVHRGEIKLRLRDLTDKELDTVEKIVMRVDEAGDADDGDAEAGDALTDSEAVDPDVMALLSAAEQIAAARRGRQAA